MTRIPSIGLLSKPFSWTWAYMSHLNLQWSLVGLVGYLGQEVLTSAINIICGNDLEDPNQK